MNHSVKSDRQTRVFFSEEGYERFHLFLSENRFSKIFILVDENTRQACLSRFMSRLETDTGTEVIEMESGEENKTLETCNQIWKVLSELGADRRSLIINLGGGVVTDLGGFVAAAFKRGIACVHFPTTLLAMVDAAVGGKNGVNLEGLKNQIGVIQPAELVICDAAFLETLPASEMRSGLAEMLKHGLIQDEAYWKKLIALDELDLTHLEDLIRESVEIKESIVEQDPRERHLRKSLNFGHTLGHAIESYFLEEPSKQKLLHGEAVAAGMVMAAFLSRELLSFPAEHLNEIKNVILSLYGRIDLQPEDEKKIIEYLKFDKKNEGGKINFVLLEKIGKPVMDCQVPNELLHQSFSYYLNP